MNNKFLHAVPINSPIQIKVENLDQFYNLAPTSIGLNHFSPQMAWSPTKLAQAASYAISIIDYEASGAMGVPFVHWLALNIFEPYIKFNDSKLNKGNLYQGEHTASQYLTHPLVEINKELAHNQYYAPFPPNKNHKYEIKIYALKHKISTNRNLVMHLSDFERTIYDAKVLNMGVFYVNSPKLSLDSNNIVVESSREYDNYHLFKAVDNSYHQIEDVKVLNIKQHIYDEAKLLENTKFPKAKIKIIDSSSAKSYAVMITSNHLSHKFGVPLVNFAQIIDKANEQRIKFKNSYGLRADLTDINPDLYQPLVDDLLILKDKDARYKGLYTIHVYGLDCELSELSKTSEDESVAGMFDLISKHVIAYTSKLFK